MSSSGAAVEVRGLSKAYSIARGAVRHSTLAEALADRVRNPFRQAKRETFWALRDLSFDIGRGEVVGIIGRNGAGKSTLLKVLSRITAPTEGEVRLYGRVGSLLEVGTGFHPELTGRENIYLNGAILGMRRREIDRQFDAIVDFAGVEQFLETPVKRYSSGMYVRLAFAVAAHLNPEILVVDEVLAVGDAEFQRKCLGKMQDVAHCGRTVLFVSHNMQSVSLLCSTGILLREGRIAYHGEVRGAIHEYLASYAAGGEESRNAERRPGTGDYRIVSARPSRAVFETDEEKRLEFRIERKHSSLPGAYLSAHIVDEAGIAVAQCDSRLVGCWLEPAEVIEGSFRFTSPWLKPGRYRVDLFICTVSASPIVDRFEDACAFTISPLLPYPCSAPPDATAYSPVLADFSWSVRPSHGKDREIAGELPVYTGSSPAISLDQHR